MYGDVCVCHVCSNKEKRYLPLLLSKLTDLPPREPGRGEQGGDASLESPPAMGPGERRMPWEGVRARELPASLELPAPLLLLAPTLSPLRICIAVSRADCTSATAAWGIGGGTPVARLFSASQS